MSATTLAAIVIIAVACASGIGATWFFVGRAIDRIEARVDRIEACLDRLEDCVSTSS